MFDSHVTSASLPLRYSVTEMLRLRIFSRTQPPQLASHQDILKRPKYIHRGSGRNFQYTHTSNKNIRSFWSTGPRPPPRTARTVSPVNHSVLSPLLKATCYTPLTCLKLCLLNTRSLSNLISSSHLIFVRLSGVGSRGEQLKQGAPDFPFPGHINQL